MLPSFAHCDNRIRMFDRRYPRSSFDDFWTYKTKLETNGNSILSGQHLTKTAERLVETLLGNPMWQLVDTGIPDGPTIERILQGMAGDYDKIRSYVLGQGSIKNIKEPIEAVFSGLDGITNRNDFPDGSKSSITGKSKVLMFLWGQLPSFDSKVREKFRTQVNPLPNLRWHDVWYTPLEFYQIAEKLDEWVRAWEAKEGKKFDHAFTSGVYRPTGRLVDIVYWITTRQST